MDLPTDFIPDGHLIEQDVKYCLRGPCCESEHPSPDEAQAAYDKIPDALKSEVKMVRITTIVEEM
jgi:hypothetical protein